MSKEKMKKQNPTSHFTLHTSNKGITLIALIITIVVMLILVAVTLMIALGENGVITTTKKAMDEHEVAAFKECVEIAAAGAFDTTTFRYNWDKFKNEVTTADNNKYENATFMFLILGGSPLQGEINNTYLENNIIGHELILKYLDSNGLESGKNIDLTNDTTHRNNIQGIIDTYGLVEITNWKVSAIRTRCSTNITLYSNTTILVECDGMQASVGFLKCTYQEYMVVMKRSEADRLFQFTEKVYDGDDYPGYVTTISNYKANAKHVDVPGIIIEEDGNYTYVTAIEANAFEKGGIKYPALYIIGLEEDEETYNNTSTLAEFKTKASAQFTGETDEMSVAALSIIENFTCEHEDDTCTKISCKNALFKELLILAGQANGFGITAENAEDYLTYDDEGKMYVLMNNNYQPVTSAQWVESKTVSIKVSEGISEIGAKAFKNCTKLETIYIPNSMSESDIASDAFEGCTSLTQITTGKKSIAESTKKWGCPNTITKTYIELFDI